MDDGAADTQLQDIEAMEYRESSKRFSIIVRQAVVCWSFLALYPELLRDWLPGISLHELSFQALPGFSRQEGRPNSLKVAPEQLFPAPLKCLLQFLIFAAESGVGDGAGVGVDA